MPFQTLDANNSGDIYEIFNYANNVSDGIFMPLMLLVIWVVAFTGSISEDRPAFRSWIFAFFIVSILSVILSLMSFINPMYMYFSILMLALGLFWAKLATSQVV